jgi:hypothetical protein
MYQVFPGLRSPEMPRKYHSILETGQTNFPPTTPQDAMHNNAVCINKKENALPNEYLIEINSIHHSQNWCLNSLITPVYFIFFVLIGQFVLSNNKSTASIKI